MLSKDEFFFTLKAVVGPPKDDGPTVRLELDLASSPFCPCDDVVGNNSYLDDEAIKKMKQVVSYVEKFLNILKSGKPPADGKYQNEVQALMDYFQVSQKHPGISGITKLEFQQNSPGISNLSFSVKTTGNGDPRPPRY